MRCLRTNITPYALAHSASLCAANARCSPRAYGLAAPKNPAQHRRQKGIIKMRGNIHRGRTNANGKAFSAKHNDRDFHLGNAENIAPSRVAENVIWKFDDIIDKPNLALDDFEQAFYERHFTAALETRNAKQIKNRHKDRVQTMEQFRANAKCCPEEDIFNIGKCGETVDSQIIKECFEEFVEWHKIRFPNVIFVDAALHLDEPNAAPHIHNRQVWVVERTDENGQTYLDISQKDALTEMGIERHDPTKKEGKYNNAKMTYTAIAREKWLDIVESRGIEVEREPQDKSHNGLTLLQLKARTAEEKVQKAEENLDFLNCVRDAVKEQVTAETEKLNKVKNEAEKIRQQTDDFVRSLEPAPTKKVKVFGGKEKEVPKTEDELQRDRKILAAQAVLQRENEVVKAEERLNNRAKQLDVIQRQTEAKEKAVENDRQEVIAKKMKLETKKKSILKIIAIKARQLADRFLRTMGIRTNKGFDVDSQARLAVAVNRERSKQYEYNNHDRT